MRYLLVSTENNDKKSIDIPDELLVKPNKRKPNKRNVPNTAIKHKKATKRLYKKANLKSKPLLNRKNAPIHHRNKR